MKFEYASDRSVILYTENSLSEKSIQTLHNYVSAIKLALGSHLISAVPSYNSVLIIFDPMCTDHQTVINSVTDKCADTKNTLHSSSESNFIRLPVYYSEETGPELDRIANHHKLSIDDVVRAHCMNVYRVYAIGFAPGFAYLGEVDENIQMPRLSTPRKSLPKGAVGIADRQTAIYPAASPGGWNIVGRCPSILFDPTESPPMPFGVGDQIQFMPISKDEFLYLGGEL